MITLYRMLTFLIYYIVSPFTYVSCLLGSQKWRHRLGYFGRDKHRVNSGCDIWLHASSLGEVKVLSIVVSALKEIDATLLIHATVMTESGYERARSILEDKISVSYLPVDYRAAITRFLGIVRPRAAVIIETEIWPNLILELSRRKIPVFLANGRLSERAAGRYRYIRSMLRPVLKGYRVMMVQTSNDRDRFAGVGADESKIKVLGSLKFDAPHFQTSPEKKSALKASLPFAKDSRILAAGSTRNKENEYILDTYRKLVDEFKDIRLILVPRHLERVGEVREIAERYGFRYTLYSRLGRRSDDIDLLIVDRMGVLNDLYSISDIAFVGGTLVDIGGQNILEPVWAGIPVLYGPSIYNVRDGSNYILESGYGDMVQNPDELCEKLRKFFGGELHYKKRDANSSRPSRARKTAEIILNCMQANAGFLAKSNRE